MSVLFKSANIKKTNIYFIIDNSLLSERGMVLSDFMNKIKELGFNTKDIGIFLNDSEQGFRDEIEKFLRMQGFYIYKPQPEKQLLSLNPIIIYSVFSLKYESLKHYTNKTTEKVYFLLYDKTVENEINKVNNKIHKKVSIKYRETK